VPWAAHRGEAAALGEAPVIRLGHLSEAQGKVFMIADNRLAAFAP
jgi:hypothetical protein